MYLYMHLQRKYQLKMRREEKVRIMKLPEEV